MAGPNAIRAALPALPRWIWVLGSGVVTLAVTIQPFRDPDVWWHLAIGRRIAASGIPSAEPFSFLNSQHPWVGQQWLYEVSLFHMVAWGGPGLASAVMGIVAAAAFVIAALSIQRAHRPSGIFLAAPILLSSLVAGPVLGVRAQVITIIGVSITLYILARWREGPTSIIWWLPPLFLLWANLHAGFIAGLVIVLLVALVHRPRGGEYRPHRGPLLLAIALSALATLATPAGLSLYPYITETFANPTLTQNIVEWSSPDFHNNFVRLFELEVIGLIVLWILAGAPRFIDVALAIGAFAATLQAQRNVAIFAVVATPQLATYGSIVWNANPQTVSIRRRFIPPTPNRVLPIGVALIIALVVASTVSPGLGQTPTNAFEQSRYPKIAADYVSRHFQGQRLYSTYEFGGYLAYRFPNNRVIFIYGESAVFGDANLQTYLDIHFLRSNWEAQLSRLQVQHAILPAESQETAVFPTIGWAIDCYDSVSGSVVMSRNAGYTHQTITDSGGAPSCA